MDQELNACSKHVANRCVAMIDVLGFRSLLGSCDLIDVVKRIHTLLFDSGTFVNSQIHSDQGNIRIRTLGEVHFGDTILMWTPEIHDTNAVESKAAIGHLIRAVTLLMYKSFLKGVPLRGGIAFGQCYIDVTNQIFVGRAIADAYELEASQDWAGGAVHPNVPFGVPGVDCLKQFRVPLKQGANISTSVALNWPDIPDSPKAYKDLRRAVYAMRADTTDPAASVKLQNSCNFLNEVYKRVRFRSCEPGSFGWFNPTEE